MRTIPRGAKLVLASHNQGKLREIAELMEPLGVEVVSAGALGLAEPEEMEIIKMGLMAQVQHF